MIPGRSATTPAPPSWGPPVLELVTPHRQLQSTQRPVQVRSELTAGRVGRCRQRPHNQRATGRQSSETVGHEMSQPAAHPVADHRVPDRLTHDEAHPGGRLTGPGGRRHLRRLGAQGMQDQPGPPSSTSPADHRPELPATGESGGRGEHGAALLRPTARRGPCAGVRTGWPGRRGYASGAGTRGSCSDAGCWAGRCACPCSRSISRLLHYHYWNYRSVSRLLAASTLRAECTPRAPAAKGGQLRGYAPTGGLTKSGVAGQVVQRDIAPLAILARTEGLWPAATLVSVPLLLWRGGTGVDGRASEVLRWPTPAG
jgi:hypothetical protein